MDDWRNAARLGYGNVFLYWLYIGEVYVYSYTDIAIVLVSRREE